MSKAKKGIKFSDEHIRKIAETKLRNKLISK